ncbi:MAG: cell division protein FtsZ [Bacteroidota bacterium]
MTIKFDPQTNSPSIIKVIGVGGGGSNAVNFMYDQGIKGVDFIITNTDKQALETSPIVNKIQLGTAITDGWGAGSIPETGRKAALETIEEIKEMLKDNTKMVFITAGMGGGTGTGAAPVIAQIAKEMGILTVGIVTLPFSFEGRKRQLQAEQGLEELRKYVDTLLVICNDKLRELHGDLKLSEAFHRADNILTIAAKGIAEIITVTGYINVDFNDVNTVMRNSGAAIMGTGVAEGENRAMKAVEMALSSPLLNDNDIVGAQNILLYISSGKEEISMDEVSEITEYIQNSAGSTAEIIWGNGNDESLGDKISVTLIATGFKTSLDGHFSDSQLRKTVVSLDNKQEAPAPKQDPIPVIEDEMKLIVKNPDVVENNEIRNTISEVETPFFSAPVSSEQEIKVELNIPKRENEMFVFTKTEDKSEEPIVDSTPIFEPINESFSSEQYTPSTTIPAEESNLLNQKHNERVDRLKKLSLQIKNQDTLTHLEKVPAYLRRNVTLDDTIPSSESEISSLSVGSDGESGDKVKPNSFIHTPLD